MSEIESNAEDMRLDSRPDVNARCNVAIEVRHGMLHRPVCMYGCDRRMVDLNYQEIVDRRRALKLEPYKSLAAVGFDGPWVTPYQITSKSSEGPVLVALHWLDEPSILAERAILESLGYLPRIRIQLCD
jgi:hypothetical protein